MSSRIEEDLRLRLHRVQWAARRLVYYGARHNLQACPGCARAVPVDATACGRCGRTWPEPVNPTTHTACPGCGHSVPVVLTPTCWTLATCSECNQRFYVRESEDSDG